MAVWVFLVGFFIRNIQQGLDSEDYGAELAKIDEQSVGLQKELMAIARMNVWEGINGGVYSEEHRKLSRELEGLRKQRDEVKAQELRNRQLRDHLAEFATLTETIDQFDGDLFLRLVERVVVKGKEVVFGLKTGLSVRGGIA